MSREIFYVLLFCGILNLDIFSKEPITSLLFRRVFVVVVVDNKINKMVLDGNESLENAMFFHIKF